MKKERIIFIIGIITIIISSIISVYAASYLYNSNEVSYNNTSSGISSDNVQGAIDELYEEATDYNTLSTKVGEDTLTTTAQNLSGAVNELNSSLNNLVHITKLGSLGSGNSINYSKNNYDFIYADFQGYGWTYSRIILTSIQTSSERKYYFNDVDGSYKGQLVVTSTNIKFQNVSNLSSCEVWGIKINK